MRLMIVLFALLLASLPVQAQTKYSTWSNPDTTTATPDLVKRLNTLIDEAEKARAADPAFLRDLRDLAREYAATPAAAPIQTRNLVALIDDFADGNFTDGPAWTVTQGRYWVEHGWGLRSAVDVQAQQQQQTKKSRNRDTALAILGAVLGQSSGGGTATTTSGQPEPAAIYTPGAIGNAFTLDLDFSSWVQQGQPTGGRFDFGPYQGSERITGYRLAYTPGTGLALVIVSQGGHRVLDQSIGPLALEDKKTHALRWTRDTRGRMTVSIDGRTILSATDRGYGDAFQGLSLKNHGGDYIVKRISVTNAN